jgi:hypothetical protein
MFTKALPARLKVLWLAASMMFSVWFLYWIFYDIFVWGKALTQVGPANYAGFVASIALVIVGTQLEKIGVLEKLLLRSEQTVYKELRQSSQLREGERILPIEQVQQIQSPKKEEDALQIPSDASVPRGCKFFLGYLHTRPDSVEIPEGCLECEHVVECLSPTSTAINVHLHETV